MSGFRKTIKKITIIAVSLGLFFGFNLSGPTQTLGNGSVDLGQATPVKEGIYNVLGPNLLVNPDFEVGTAGGLPDNWNHVVYKGGTGTERLVSDEKQSGNMSLGLPEIAGVKRYQGVESDPINVEKGEYYRLSFWLKTNNAVSVSNLSVGVEEYDGNGVYLSRGGGPDFNTFVLRNKVKDFPTEWTEYTGVTRIKADTSSVRIEIFSLTDNGKSGTRWFDNFSFQKLERNVYGCANSATAKCLDLASDQYKLQASLSLTKRGEPYLGHDAFGDKQTEIDQNGAQVGYRIGTDVGSDTGKILLGLSAFNVGADGFPTSPMILEIRYKNAKKTDGSPVSMGIYSEVFETGSGKPPTIELTDLGETESSSAVSETDGSIWRVRQIAFGQNAWQRIRALGGKFNFVLDDGGADHVPISYIALHSISEAQYRYFVSTELTWHNLKDLSYVETSTNVPAKDLTWFVPPAMKPIYPNRLPAPTEIEKAFSLSSPKGETETASFGLYAKTAKNGVAFSASDLVNSQGNKITASKISFRLVNYNYRTVSAPLPSYALMPDFVSKFSSLDLPANESTHLLLKIAVPADAVAGTYTGQVTAGTLPIPVSLKVYDYALESDTSFQISNQLSAVNSWMKESFFQEFAEAKVIPVLELEENDRVIKDSRSPIPLDKKNKPIPPTANDLTFDVSHFDSKVAELKSRGLVTDGETIFVHGFMTTALSRILGVLGVTGFNSTNISTQLAALCNTEGATAFGRLMSQFAAIQTKYNIQLAFTSTDEPGGGFSRIFSSYLDRLARENGVKTWVTFPSSSFEPLNLSATYSGVNFDICVPNECYLERGKYYARPLGETLDYIIGGPNEINQNDLDKAGNKYGFYTTYMGYSRTLYPRIKLGLTVAKANPKFVYVYKWGVYAHDPFDNFNGADDVLSYPAWSGEILPTYGWEMAMEGMKDSRYISTLRKLIVDKPNLPDSIAAKDYLDKLLAKIRLSNEDPCNLGDITIVANEGGCELGDDATDPAYENLTVANLSATNDPLDYTVFDTMRSTLTDFIEKIAAVKLVSVTITADKQYASSGAEVTLTVTVQNITDKAVSDVVVSSRIPVGSQYVAGSADHAGTLADNNSVIKWTIGSLAKDEVVELQYKAKIN